MDLLTLLPLISLTLASCPRPNSTDLALPCYTSPLPTTPLDPSPGDSRPWSSQTQRSAVLRWRAGIDEVDSQILRLLGKSAGYVREATGFKPTLPSVDVPSRDTEVIESAVKKGAGMSVPGFLSRAVFEGVISGGVGFERCVWAQFEE